MFKKITSMMMALVLCLSLCIPAFAAMVNYTDAGGYEKSYETGDTASGNGFWKAAPRTRTNAASKGRELCDAVDISSYKVVYDKVTQVTEGVYAALDDGEIVAYYEEASSDSIANSVQPRAGWAINWTLNSGKSAIANTQVTSYDGLAFDCDIAFSKSGLSWIGYAAHDEGVIHFLGSSTNGFVGKVCLVKESGLVSLAIENDSDNTITYSGTYHI